MGFLALLRLVVLWAMSGISLAQTQTVTSATITPGSTPAGVGADVTVTAAITDPSVIASSVNLQILDPLGRASVVGNLHDDGLAGDAIANDKNFSIRFSIYQERPTTLSYRVSAAFLGRITRVFSNPLGFSVTGTVATGVALIQPTNLAFVNTSPIIVTGSTGDPKAMVVINGIQATKTSNAFQASIPLQEGNNTLTAVASNSNGTTSTASIQVTLDTMPPRLSVESPATGTATTEASVTVTGIINDIVVGTVNSLQAKVTVNGIAATVSNRTFTAPNVPLIIGENNLQVIGRDQVGNSATITHRIVREQVSQPFIKLISGNNQTGAIGSQLPQPLVVQLLNGGTPVPNTPVIFKITENDGNLQAGNLTKVQLAVINSDAQGKAQVLLTLGNRAGAGNNVVEAYAAGLQGTAIFTASATPKAAAKINIDSGNNQFGPVNQQLPLPFVAVVTDQGHNRLSGVKVTFTVKQGGGKINGQAVFTTTTDGDGRALALLTLGTQPGQDNNIVQASFVGSSGLPAAFTASARVPGDPNQTSISGVVLDNSNTPIPHVTMRVFRTNQGNTNNQPQQAATPVTTNDKGLFVIKPAPVGFYKLMADGTTATAGGRIYPTLEYDIVTVAGQENTVGSPIYLPELDPQAKLCVDDATGGILKLSKSPGFSLTIAAGSATFPGGSKTGCVTVTPVNPDKVPMVPGFGQQPRYVVTIQPVGTTFNPPAAITIPNMDGLAPNAKTEMYSYDHDLAAFVSIGSGTVSRDGSVISSDPGVGVIKAGWHCGGNPNSSGSCCECSVCNKCSSDSCAPDDGQVPDPSDKCTVCKGGSPSNIELKPAKTITESLTLPQEAVGKFNQGLEKLKDIGVFVSIVTNALSVSYSEEECCEKTTIGKSTKRSGSISGTVGSIDVNVRIWPGPGVKLPEFESPNFLIGLTLFKFKIALDGGVFIGFTDTVSGTIGYTKNGCSLDSVEKNGCFDASVGLSIEPKLAASLGGSACLFERPLFSDVINSICAEAKGSAEAKLGFRIDAITYNKPKCGAGLAGGVPSIQNATFMVPAGFAIKGTFGSDSIDINRTWNFLSCDTGNKPMCEQRIF